MKTLTEALSKLEKIEESVEEEKIKLSAEQKTLKESLLRKAGQVNASNCKSSFELTKAYEKALQEGINNIYPDIHWSDATKCDIFSTLLYTNNNIDETVKKILLEAGEQSAPPKKAGGKKNKPKPLNESMVSKKKSPLKEGRFDPMGTNEGAWRGCKDIDMIWNGEWSDPDLVYKEYVFNYSDIEDALWDAFLEETGYDDSQSGDPKVEAEFDAYVRENAPDYLDDYIFAGAPKSWHKDYGDEEEVYDDESFYDESLDKDWPKKHRKLTENKWEYTLESGHALRDAIDSGDLWQVQRCLINCYQELFDKGVIDEDDFEAYTQEVDEADMDDPDVEDYLDFELNEFYDLCDNCNVWVSLNEELNEDAEEQYYSANEVLERLKNGMTIGEASGLDEQ